MTKPTLSTTRWTTSALALLMAGSLATASPAPGAPTPISVGDFVLLYAKAVQLSLPPQATVETACAALKAAGELKGVDLSLDRGLTHGDLVRIGRAGGLKITSSTPDRVLDRTEAEMFLSSFSGILAARSGARVAASSGTPGGDPANHARTDKGKKKGRPFQSPSEPL